MPKPSVDTLLADPDFQSMDIEGQREILSEVSPAFKGFTAEKQNEALADVSNLRNAPPSGLKQSTIDTLAQNEAAVNQYISAAQASPLSKLGGAALGVGKALVSPVAAGFKAIGPSQQIFNDPSRAVPTVLEGARRAGLDIIENAPTNVSLAKYLTPGAGQLNAVIDAYNFLKSRTPTREEAQAAIEGQTLGNAIEEESNKVAFPGAVPEVAQAGREIAPFLMPAGEGGSFLSKAIAGTEKSVANVPRMIRTALKPAKNEIAAKVEKAASEEIGDIFTANPMADKAASIPFEGFANEVENAIKSTGERISEIRGLSSTPIDAGNKLATIMESKAADLRKSGRPDIADELLTIAEQKKGSMIDLNSLQDAVTMANRKPSILKKLKTDAEDYADAIVAKEGGSLINKELDNIKGPEGAQIRKKWSNLKVLHENVQSRLNNIINNAPVESRPAILEALASPQGAASVFALVQGWTLPGAVGLVGKTVSNWAKNQIKDLKNPNKIIENTYDILRKNPPIKKPPFIQNAPVAPPVIPEPDLNEIIARSLSDQGPRAAIPSNELDDIIRQLSQEQAGSQLGQQF